jgi:hypothetical protein
MESNRVLDLQKKRELNVSERSLKKKKIFLFRSFTFETPSRRAKTLQKMNEKLVTFRLSKNKKKI